MEVVPFTLQNRCIIVITKKHIKCYKNALHYYEDLIHI